MPLTENQAYGKAKELEDMFTVFEGVREVLQAADEARKRTVTIKKENDLLLKALDVDKEKKKKSEQFLARFEADSEKRRKEVREAESTEKSAYLSDRKKWNTAISDKKKEYNAMIIARSTEYDNLISAKTSELEAKENWLAKVNKEIDDVKKLVTGE